MSAADYLAHPSNLHIADDRVFWTGIVVTYARPFTKNKVGKVPEGITSLSPELKRLHRILMRRRNDFFAHTDETPFREEVDVYALLGLGSGKFAEQYVPPHPRVLPEIARLAREQATRLRQRRDEVEEQLGRHVAT